MKNLLLITILFLTLSCQSVKDGLTMQKKNNSDEFLIQKKNPLILPPDYGKLPKPGEKKKENKISKVNEIEELLNKNIKNESTKKRDVSQIENIILNEIKAE